MLKLRPISTVIAKSKSRGNVGQILRAEFPLFIGLASAGFFLWLGNAALDHIPGGAMLAGVFVWLFVGVLWSAMSVTRHADCLAIKLGEPYGTLILTLSAIAIEVIMISAAVLHGANNPTLARDMMFAVVMIALNGLIGLSLLLGGWRHREQHYNLQGTSAYLNTIMALSVLGLVLPNYTSSLSGPRFTLVQEEFLIVSTLILYAVFLAMQTSRHRHHFVETEAMEEGGHAHDLAPRSAGFHAVMLFLFLGTVIVLAEKLAIPLDNMVERFGIPQAFGGAVVAALVLAPEGLAGIKAARQNQLQRSVNILHGSVLATIGLTIPAVLTIGIVTHREMRLGIEGGNLPLLVLTLGSSIVTFGSGRTSVLQGCIHLLLFGVFILLIFCP